VLAKRTLTRIVRRPDGILVDLTGKLSGRGAYLHNRRSCWERGIKGALARALKTELIDADVERLQAFLAQLPEDDNEQGLPQVQPNTSMESGSM
jgi:uncharacterized protein